MLGGSSEPVAGSVMQLGGVSFGMVGGVWFGGVGVPSLGEVGGSSFRGVGGGGLVRWSWKDFGGGLHITSIYVRQGIKR